MNKNMMKQAQQLQARLAKAQDSFALCGHSFGHVGYLAPELHKSHAQPAGPSTAELEPVGRDGSNPKLWRVVRKNCLVLLRPERMGVEEVSVHLGVRI